MSTPGWYPDPGGQKDMYRYWDGSAWSAALSPNPNAAPPGQYLGAPQSATPQPGDQQPRVQQPGDARPGPPPRHGGYPGQPQAYGPGATPPAQRSHKGWWIAAIAALIALIVLGSLGIRSLLRAGGDSARDPSVLSSRDVCPPPSTASASPRPKPNDGRVHGGQLSYPQLGVPWSPPRKDVRVPFGRDTLMQDITIERNYQPGNNWVASVLVAELMAGDGFFSPQQGSEIVVKCIVGEFYGGAKVDRQDRENKAMTVDGREAWLVESHLSFDINGLQTKGELAIVLIVKTSDTASSLYYASIPDTSPQYVQPARDAMAALKVDS